MSPHILLTGASSGVGRALAIKLSKLGVRLSLTGRNTVKLDETLSYLDAPCQVYSSAFCLTNLADIDAFCFAAVKYFGPVNMLVNCAGINSSRAAAVKPDWYQLEQMMKVNFLAPLRFTENCSPAMLTAKKGIILNVLSTTCLYSNKNIAQYSASKSALDSYSKILRKELHSTGVKVLSLYPGGIDSDFREQEKTEYLQPQEVADVILTMLFSSSKLHIHEMVLRPEIESNFS